VNNSITMSPMDTYEKLLEVYSHKYRNPKAALNYQIDELMSQGKTREEAIAAIYEREKGPEDKQTSLEKRVKQLESELNELKMPAFEVETNEAGIRGKGLSLGEAILIFLTSPISAIIAWLIWHENEHSKADQAATIGVLVFALEIVAYWFLFQILHF